MTTDHVTAVNLWSEADHARRYLDRRDRIPHRAEGYAVLLELLPEAVGRVLDLGTGDGLLLDMVRGARPGAGGIALDFSDEMLAAAADRFGGATDVEIVRHDLDQPLPDLGAFDVVVSAFAIHHTSDARKRALYAEVLARLEPGGLFANLEHVASPTEALHREFLAAIGTPPEHDDPSNQLAAVEDQLTWLRELGYVDVDCFWKWRELALLAGRAPG